MRLFYLSGSPTRRVPEGETHKALSWFRGIGVGTVLVGVMGFIGVIPFWWAVGFVEFGFLVWIADILILEVDLSRWSKVAIVTLLLALVSLFNIYFVFSSAPVSITVAANAADYPPDHAPNGWRPTFSELLVTILNPSEEDYDHVSIYIKPDRPVAMISQLSDVNGVSFMHGYNEETRIYSKSHNRVESIPFVLVATDAGYYVRIDKLPSGRPLELQLAVAGIKNTNGCVSIKDDDCVFREDLTNSKEKVSFWYAHPNHSNNVYEPRQVTRVVAVQIKYIARLKPRDLNETLQPTTF